MSKNTNDRFKRNYNTRKIFKFIYIFTEGEKTEVIYFNSKKKAVETEIRRKNIKVEIKGKGYNTLSLVDFAIDYIKDNNININDPINSDECWVVFDKDDFKKNFNAAINKAINNNLKVAYSNESFELWFLLHFCYLSSAISRKDYVSKLTDFLRKTTGSKKIQYSKSLDMYSFIRNNELDAIKNAKKLLNIFKDEKSYSEKNPSTTVHQLVERLNELK